MNHITKDNYLKKTDEAIRSKEYDEAYMFCNADLTKYLIGMKRHTELLLKSNSKAGNALLEIDLKALEEIFNKLSYITYNGGIKFGIDEKFGRIEEVFDNKKYHELIRFYRVLLICIFDDNREKVRELLIDYDYNEIDKVELLELFYENVASEYEYCNMINVLLKIIDKEPNGIQKIKYSMILALKYNINGEIQSSIDITKHVVELIEEINGEDLAEYEYDTLASTYFYCALILNDNSFYKLCIDTYNLLLDKIDKTQKEEISNIYNDIGEAYLMDGEYYQAIIAFNKSLENKANHLSLINISRANIELGRFEDAVKEIYDLNIDSIPEINLLDYLITMGRILIKKDDRDKAKEIFDTLKQLEVEEKLFRNYRNDVLIDLLEKYKGFYVDKTSTSLSNTIDRINQSLELKPNFMGIGINFNYIINRFLNK
jgi:tetratricopeptide (TPR) repeat protein